MANRPIGNLFVGQDANALLQSFTSPAFGPSSSPTIAANQAVLVRAVYFLGLIVVANIVGLLLFVAAGRRRARAALEIPAADR